MMVRDLPKPQKEGLRGGGGTETAAATAAAIAGGTGRGDDGGSKTSLFKLPI